jgi:RNA polymerase sigma-70 factor, ECF subfamily
MLDAAVIQQLAESHRQFLSFVQKRVESREVAEDILQSAFARSMEHASELRDNESAVAWFYRVLRNATIDHYRRRDATQRAYDGWAKELVLRETPDSLARTEICQCVSELAATLKPEYRDALQVIDVEEGSLNDLAGKVGITAGNAAVRVHRAREALRKQLIAACGTCAEHGCLDCQCEPKSSGGCHADKS